MTDYEKTIIELALSYANHGYSLKYDSDIYQISQMLDINCEWFAEALKYQEADCFSPIILFRGETFHISGNQPILDAIIKYHFILKDLGKMENKMDISTLRENCELFADAVSLFELMNTFLASSEAERAEGFPFYEYLLFNEDAYLPKTDLDTYRFLLCVRDYTEDSVKIDQEIHLLQLTMKYNLLTHANALYLVAVAQAISHSSYLNDTIKTIAREFFLNTIAMLRNGRVIAVQANILYQDLDKPFEDRTKQSDNTTRLRIVYGYDNLDAYELRLDLAHQGEGFVHYNNISPGGVKCCLFKLEEYNEIVEKYPDLRECFIVYADLAALKERKNCKFTPTIKEHYEAVRESQEHIQAVSSSFREEDVVTFIEIFQKILPSTWVCKIDKDGTFVKYCFNHDMIMTRAVLLCYALMANDTNNVKKILEYIVDRGISYGLIDNEEKILYDDISGICDLIQLSNNRILYYSGQSLLL